jgi:hypothetical protein
MALAWIDTGATMRPFPIPTGPRKRPLSFVDREKMKRRKTKGRPKAALSNTHTQQYNRKSATAQRKPANWFMDAACFATDGDDAQATLAVLRGLYAMACI